ncbi:MAG: FAD-dependent oxidoreductase, partial [Candidatus Omnitrophica bacterium]|nr:FAD-dependent oxidoreductase [Candidatus Omnitrophota bacterium]
MAKKRILILGGGLSGLSVAWYLQKKGIDCQIFEKESEVGGLCRSKKIGGFTFDYDGHLLHFRHNNTLRFIKNLLGNNLVKHKRNAEIFSFERFSRFPFQSNLYGFPKPVIEECLEGFIKAHHDGYRKKKTDSFGDWINRQLGPGIAKHFMIPYNTKFWTILPQKLTCEWVDGFISVPSLEEMIEGTIKESKINLGYNAFFWYPKRGGINEFPLALAGQLKNIFTSCEVTKIDLTNKRIKLANGSEERFDLLLSTLPLPELPFLIKDIPEKINSVFKKLRWNSIFNINLGTEREAGYARHWIYFPEKDFCFFRVGFPHSFSHSIVPKGKGSLYIEV